jgi:RNA polymerase sigma-70 factor (ECF subfamily)
MKKYEGVSSSNVLMDKSAFEDMYRQNYSRVLAFALRRTSSSLADDVVAATFLVAWRRRGEIVGDPLPWLFGIARRVLANELRSAGRAEALANRAGAEVERFEQPLPELELRNSAVARALGSLGSRDREALVLIAWDELSPEEAARVVGCSAATFRVRLHRARKRLTRALVEVEANTNKRALCPPHPVGSPEPKG